MKVVRHYNKCPDSAKNSVVALGNFDGVHLGHKAIIKKTLEVAKKEGLPSAVMTFEPHPATILSPNKEPFRITPVREKISLIKELGVDILFLMRFNHDFSLITAEGFVKKILIESLNIKHAVIGYDFIFGNKRSGNAVFLKKMAEKYGFSLIQLEAVSENGKTHSSTKIREYLKEGNIEKATAILGHNYIIEGRVIKGEQRGNQLGFHTANIPLKDHIRPAFGVYIAKVRIENEATCRNAVINIGKRPTFGKNSELMEVHLLDFNKDLYGKKLRVQLIKHLRPEKKFSGIEELREQIKKDCERAISYFNG